MPQSPEELVTVIVPAYTAAATLDETLLSVRAQSHASLQIIVVDDGSVDATAQIAERHRQADARVTLIRHAVNQGVAAARNTGIAAATAELIAPIDADDLWHPRKIEKQVAAMRRGGRKVGLVYTWSALLDAQSHVTALADRNICEGDVLRVVCEYNMVGNGSSPLMRTEAVRQAGGYDTSLFELNAQGCEDWALYLAIAESFDFAVVPEYLTGYRRSLASMSTDHAQMFRSFCLFVDKVRARRPDLAHPIREAMSNMCHNAYRRERHAGRSREARALLRRLMLTMPYQALKIFAYRPLRQAVRQRLGSQPAPGVTGPLAKFPAQWPT